MRIAVDAGRSEIRATDGARIVRFQNLIAPQVDRMMEGEERSDTHEVNYKGESLTIGAGARGRHAHPSLGSSKVDQETIAMILTAIFRVSEEAHYPFPRVLVGMLGIGLPIHRYRQDKPHLIGALKGEHEIAVNGIQKRIVIDEIVVIPEGFGVYWNELVDGQGDIKNSSLASGTIGVIDIGHRTTDFLVVEDQEMVDDFSHGSDKGIITVIQEARKEIELKHGVTFEPQKLEEAIRTGAYRLDSGRGPIDITPFINAASRNVAQSLIADIRGQWGDKMQTIKTLIMAGGGGKFFTEAFRNGLIREHTNIVLAEDPRYANLKGYFKFIS